MANYDNIGFSGIATTVDPLTTDTVGTAIFLYESGSAFSTGQTAAGYASGATLVATGTIGFPTEAGSTTPSTSTFCRGRSTHRPSPPSIRTASTKAR